MTGLNVTSGIKQEITMNKAVIIISGVALLLAASSAQSAIIMDNYIGANDHGYGDVVGNVNNFQINSMNVEISGTILTVSVDTTFAGKGDNGLFRNSTFGRKGVGYGDLFLSNTWTPSGDGSHNYINDDSSNGTVWSYGFSLDDRWMNENDNGTGTLYSLNAGLNSANINMSDSFLSRGYFRNNQEVAVDRDSLSTSALGNAGSWGITGNTVDFTIDLAGTNLLDGSELALRWEFTCANDVIEGAVAVPSVPVPAAVWLFGSGLIGLVGFARRRKS